ERAHEQEQPPDCGECGQGDRDPVDGRRPVAGLGHRVCQIGSAGGGVGAVVGVVDGVGVVAVVAGVPFAACIAVRAIVHGVGHQERQCQEHPHHCGIEHDV